MKKSIIILSLMMLLSSCHTEIRAKFEITNNTDNSIDSIKITSSDHHLNNNYLSLESGESKTYWLDMTELPKVDGDYLLSYKRNNDYVYERFGYFTNGYPLEKLTKIQIKKDSVIIIPIIDIY